MKYNRNNHLEHMLETFSHKALLENVIKSLSNTEAKDCFDYISRMWDVPEYRPQS